MILILCCKPDSTDNIYSCPLTKFHTYQTFPIMTIVVYKC